MRSYLFAAALFATAFVVQSQSAFAYECKSFRTMTSASANMKFRAANKARADWRDYTRQRFGLPWSVWDIAKDKNTICRKASGGWTCHAVGKACKYVVG